VRAITVSFVRNRGIRDVPFFAVSKMKCEPSSLGRACICTFAASDPASPLGERERTELLASYQFRKPLLFLFVRAEQQ